MDIVTLAASKGYTKKQIGTISSGLVSVTYDETTSKITATYTNGSTIEYTIPTLKGKGIKNTVLNDDYTLTITYDDDSTYTTGSIRGEKGEKGEKGEDGKVMDVKVNGTSVLKDNEVNLTIHNDVTSTTTNEALSANMGKELQAQISSLKNIGRFLSIWDCTTGLPLTDPVEGVPYAYKTGDYYRVGTVASSGGTNYKPNGATYTKTASTTEESGDVEVGAVYYYDGDSWEQQAAGAGGKVQDVQINGTSIVSADTGVANIPMEVQTITFTDASGVETTLKPFCSVE